MMYDPARSTAAVTKHVAGNVSSTRNVCVVLHVTRRPGLLWKRGGFIKNELCNKSQTTNWVHLHQYQHHRLDD